MDMLQGTAADFEGGQFPANSTKSWFYWDGSIRRNGVHDRQNAGVGLLKSFYSKVIVSHTFLGIMLSVILLFPERSFRYKNFFARCLRYSKKLMKRGLDVTIAILGLMASSIIFLFLPLLIRLDSHGSVLFKQVRIGKNRRKKDRRILSVDVPVERRKRCRRQADLLGKPFILYKFRSMKENAEKKTGPVWATPNDPRITNVGKYLRTYHLDEIPQLVNVLRGEMSVVGPRPERPEFVTKLKSEIPNYADRFKGKPGITGLAQITCGYDTSIEDVNNKLNFDLQYLSKPDVGTDLRILWQTLRRLSFVYRDQVSRFN